MMGMQTTLVGPIKYAHLPQYLNEYEILGGKSMAEIGSFVAILLWQIVGSCLAIIAVSWF
jgi:hypothetical protein